MNLVAELFGTAAGPFAVSELALSALLELAEASGATANAAALYEAGLKSGAIAAHVPHQAQVVDGVAVVALEGLLVRKPSWIASLLGATVLSEFTDAVRAVAADPAVRGIVLSIDSPGGSVHGTGEAAAAVRVARAAKPVVAYAGGTAASAAYWIGCQADAVVANPVALVGSIGVVATHTDVSGAMRAAGRQVTEITAGRYKRIASSYAPLSDEGRSTLQDQVDAIYAAFVEAVAEGRGVSATRVLDRMADGRVFVGQQAVAAGLADSLATSLDDVLASVRQSLRS